jgi:hypothetical protein
MNADPQRRRVLKGACITLFAIPLAAITRNACAGRNASLREKFHYQDTPGEGKTCTQCLEFIPGKSEQSPGACKQIPGDDEIAPQGFCSLWNTL